MLLNEGMMCVKLRQISAAVVTRRINLAQRWLRLARIVVFSGKISGLPNCGALENYA